MSTRTGTSFFHVDGHRRHFGRSTGTLTNFTLSYFPCPTYFLASRSDILACRQAHLLFFTILSVQPTFWHCGGIILACRRGHFGMSTGTFTILGFTIPPCPPIVWHRRASFWHVDGAHLLFYTLLFSLSNQYFGIAGPRRRAHVLFRTLLLFPASLLFGIAGRHFACRRGDFGMSTGTFTISYYTLYYIPLSNQLVGIAGRHFGMSTGSFWHVDGHIYYFTLCSSPWPTNFLASQGIILACRRAHLLFYILLFPFPTYFFALRGVILACRRAHLLSYSLLSPFPTYLLASRGVVFGTPSCRSC